MSAWSSADILGREAGVAMKTLSLKPLVFEVEVACASATLPSIYTYTVTIAMALTDTYLTPSTMILLTCSTHTVINNPHSLALPTVSPMACIHMPPCMIITQSLSV